MTGIYWPIWWLCEMILLSGAAFVWCVPLPRALRASRNAIRLYEQASKAITDRQAYAEADTLLMMADVEWSECFAWHALSHRIHRVTMPVVVVFACMVFGWPLLTLGLRAVGLG